MKDEVMMEHPYMFETTALYVIFATLEREGKITSETSKYAREMVESLEHRINSLKDFIEAIKKH